MEFCAILARGTAPSKRAFHTCSVLEGSLYVFGGITDDRTVLSDMYRYDISSNSWSAIESRVPRSSQSRPEASSVFPKGRLCTAPSVSHHTATVIWGRFILIIGGWNGRKRCADVFLFWHCWTILAPHSGIRGRSRWFKLAYSNVSVF